MRHKYYEAEGSIVDVVDVQSVRRDLKKRNAQNKWENLFWCKQITQENNDDTHTHTHSAPSMRSCKPVFRIENTASIRRATRNVIGRQARRRKTKCKKSAHVIMFGSFYSF